MIDNQTPAKQTPKKNRLPAILLIVVVIVSITVAAIIAVAVRNNDSPSQTTPVTTEQQSSPQSDAALLGELQSQSVAPQEIVNVDVYVTSEIPINTVTVNLKYPTENFEFVGIEDEQSAFSVKAAGKEEGGLIEITRGSFETVTGKQLVATIQLRALSSEGTAELTFEEGSQVIEPVSATNVLGSSPSVKITFEN